MSKGFEYNQVIKQVSGLNSISTLKKWRLKIERLTGHQFEEGQVQTGKRSYSKVYCFTESDIETLQKIADLKGSIGLNKAILKAYAPTRASPLSVKPKAQPFNSSTKQNHSESDGLNDTGTGTVCSCGAVKPSD